MKFQAFARRNGVISMLVLLTAASCGVRQFNSGVETGPMVPTAETRIIGAHIPFEAGGLAPLQMATTHCGSTVGRPCIQAVGALGSKQFDPNPNRVQGPVRGATSEFGARGSYSGTAQKAGEVTDGTRNMSHRHLKLMEDQVNASSSSSSD